MVKKGQKFQNVWVPFFVCVLCEWPQTTGKVTPKRVDGLISNPYLVQGNFITHSSKCCV